MDNVYENIVYHNPTKKKMLIVIDDMIAGIKK